MIINDNKRLFGLPKKKKKKMAILALEIAKRN